MKFTVKEGLEYFKLGNEMDYTEERLEKIESFIKKFPHNPRETRIQHVSNGIIKIMYIKDFEKGWFAEVYIGYGNNKIIAQVVDGDNLDTNENRVKTNHEALELLEIYHSLKYMSDIDKYWQMSDDHKYVNRCYEHDKEVGWEKDDIALKLK